jgi:hypothetical protein
MSWFPAFLYLWAAGMAGSLSFVPATQVGRRFFQVHAVILIVLAGGATVFARPLFDGFSVGTLPLLTGLVAWMLILDVALIAGLVFSRRPIVPVAFLVPVITGAFLAVAIAFGLDRDRPAQAALMTAHFVTCGALLGLVVVAMNLGHSYLQDASRSFEPLTRLAKLFVGSAIAKAVVCLILLAPRAGEIGEKMGGDFDWMMVAVRAGCLAFYLVLGFMVLSCARARANQSATGILYAAVVFVLVGEGFSMYLTLGREIRA